VPFRIAAELAAAVSQHAQELDIVLLEERQHTVIEQIQGYRCGGIRSAAGCGWQLPYMNYILKSVDKCRCDMALLLAR
jgi:hypothetical protein